MYDDGTRNPTYIGTIHQAIGIYYVTGTRPLFCVRGDLYNYDISSTRTYHTSRFKNEGEMVNEGEGYHHYQVFFFSFFSSFVQKINLNWQKLNIQKTYLRTLVIYRNYQKTL